MEHPSDAESWNTETLQLPGTHDALLHRCRTGLTIFDPFGRAVGLAKKPTRFRSTIRHVAEQLDLKCECETPHVSLHGNPLERAQNYEKPLAKLLAKAILKDVQETKRAFVTEDVEPNKEDVEHKELLAELRGNFDDNVIKSVARMHQQLGHPSPDRLASELAD